MGEQAPSMESIKERLDELVTVVSDDDLPLEEALSYYEEAVELVMTASDLVEHAMESPVVEGEEAPSQQEGEGYGR